MTPDEEDLQKRPAKLPEEHWAVAREGKNAEAMEYLRERSRAPGVAEGGAVRNHYCMNCNGVIPLNYDRRTSSAERTVETCPHCGHELDQRVRAMFNWVETDEVPGSDLKILLPFVAVGLLVVALGLFWIFG